ncbi:MAG: carbohydrate porin [Burkholderiaceae bacterium]
MTSKFLIPALVLLVIPVQAAALDLGTIEVEGSINAVGQRINAEGSADGSSQSRLSYRGDLGISLPLGSMAGGDGQLVTQLRFGQGEGVTTVPTRTGAVNSLAFQADEQSSNTVAILSQIYYQWQSDDQRRNRYSLVVGKLDPFGFFDQNAVADDESESFLNNVFVHNPLLDSGGDIGADEYGFTPGLVASWNRYDDAGSRFGGSFGVFGVEGGADFKGSPGRALSIVQLEFGPRAGTDESLGTWRLYAWHNPQSSDPAGSPEPHSGWGISADQKLTNWMTAFGRYGKGAQGSRAFDSALTVGLELNGIIWSRAEDRAGLALGRLFGDSTANASGGDESVTEVFYRAVLSPAISITPHWQTIRTPDGDRAAKGVQVIGVRAKISF